MNNTQSNRSNASFLNKINNTDLQKIILESKSIAEVLRKIGYKSVLGIARHKLKKRISDHKLDEGKIYQSGNKQSLTKDEFVTRLRVYEPGTVEKVSIRHFVKKFSLIEEKCKLCNCPPIWNNLPLILELDHIDGNNLNNKLENLRFLCPNCHQQQPTSSRIKRYHKASDKDLIDSFRKNSPSNIRQLLRSVGMSCISINYKWAYKVLDENGIVDWLEKKDITKFGIESIKKRRKFEHPTKDILEKMIDSTPISTIGKQFNVSGNAIKKLCKKYKIQTKPRGYWAKNTNLLE